MTTTVQRKNRRWPILCAVCVVSTALGQEKTPVKSLDDLPRHTYKIPGSVSELLKSDEQFTALAKAVRADLEADLAKYQIEDAATLPLTSHPWFPFTYAICSPSGDHANE